MYSLVLSRTTSYLIKYNLFTTISELSDLYTKTCLRQLSETGTGVPSMEIESTHLGVSYDVLLIFVFTLFLIKFFI